MHSMITTVDITHHSSKIGTATYTGHQCHERRVDGYLKLYEVYSPILSSMFSL